MISTLLPIVPNEVVIQQTRLFVLPVLYLVVHLRVADRERLDFIYKCFNR